MNCSAMSLPQSNAGRQILLIDDSVDSLDSLLREAGYSVYQASDRWSAMRIVRDYKPALVLVDISAPTIDGQRILQSFKGELKLAAIPIIFVGPSDRLTTDKMQSLRYGVTEYIAKSVGSEELLARLRIQVSRQLAKQQQQRLNADLTSRLQERDRLLDLARDQLLEVALSDRLTRLPNRLSFVKRLSKVMAKHKGPLATVSTRRNGSSQASGFAILFLDCDRFKRVNDSLGHRAGDLLLKEIAQRLLSVQRAHRCVDTVARFGGDEFAVLVSEIRNRSAAMEVAEDILTQLSRPFRLAEREIYMSASIGMVWGEAGYTTPEHMLRDADMAMYQAKASYRSQYYWFESDMHHRAVDLLQLETDLHLALARKEFELYYQPIVDLSCLKITGFEALVRWHHPERGLLLPGEFIDFAENSGFIISLGQQVLEMACADIARWVAQEAMAADITVSVNIAAQQLLQPDILEKICEPLDRWNLNPQRLRLELTERSILDSRAFVDDVLSELQRRGIRLSIDDFGVGYSALSYLHTLPVNCLKVDRSFVHPITEDPSSLGIVPLIINIAKTMNMQVVAEGIENKTQIEQLQKLGCHYGQGFLFQKAVPAERAIALLREPFGEPIGKPVAEGTQPVDCKANEVKASA